MEFSLKLVVSMIIAISLVLVLSLLLQSQTGGFASWAGEVIPLS